MSDVSRDRFRSTPLRAEWDLVRAAGVPRECFADEVAIDFPSVDRFVERLRDGFARGGAWDVHDDNARCTVTAAPISRSGCGGQRSRWRGLRRNC